MCERYQLLKGQKKFIHLNDIWFIQYEWTKDDELFKYGLRLRYKNHGTAFKYLRKQSPGYESEILMKKAIKSEVSKWLLEIKIKYNPGEIPIGQVQELVHPQLTLF